MNRRAFLEVLCASIAAAGWTSPAKAELATGEVVSSFNFGSDAETAEQSLRSAVSTSITGDWRIRLDSADVGVDGRWFQSVDGFSDIIPLPGSTDEHHFGRKNDEVARQHLTRAYLFTGPVWYERDITIPESWQAKRVVFFLERCHWETRAWLDGLPLGIRNSLSTPHIYELGFVGLPQFGHRGAELLPGPHRLTVRVDNRTQVDVGESSATTAEVGATWNGIIGRMELQTSDRVWIDRLMTFPQAYKKQVSFRILVRNVTGMRYSGRLEANIFRMGQSGPGISVTKRVDVSAMPVSTLEDNIELGSDAAMWDEFSPALFEITVLLAIDEEHDKFRSSATSLLGLREISTSGRQIRLNGNPMFFRGTVDNGTFPLTGYDPMDVAFWRERLRIYRDYGLNHVRFHSWCPPDAAFTAADELGMLFQVANPMWIPDGRVSADDERMDFIREEAFRIVDTYGNHPSFALMSMGNEEGSGQDPFLGGLVRSLQEHDSRHLYTSTSAPDNIHRPDNYFVSAGPVWTNLRGDPRFENDAPDTSTDYGSYVRAAGIDRPVIAHEVGQWTVFPNFDEGTDYIGPLQPRYFEVYGAALARTGLTAFSQPFRRASGQLTVALYKEEIESLLRTPDVAGFQLLGLTDFPGFGPAFIGVLDTLSKTKGLITPEEFRRFSCPTVPLLRIDKRVWRTRETLIARLDVAHYGPAALRNTEVNWTVRRMDGATETSGSLPATTIPSGGLTQLGTMRIELRRLPAAAQYSIECSVGNFANAWNIWVYPEQLPVSTRAVTIVNAWDRTAHIALQDGKTVVFLPNPQILDSSVPMSFTTVFWAAEWFPERHETMGVLCDPQHPALKLFPTQSHSDWQWWELTSKSRAFDLTAGPAELEPIVRIIDDAGRSRRLGAVIEAKVGRGKLLATSFDLASEPQKRLVARQLRASLLRYAESRQFDPKTECSMDYLDSIFRSQAH